MGLLDFGRASADDSDAATDARAPYGLFGPMTESQKAAIFTDLRDAVGGLGGTPTAAEAAIGNGGLRADKATFSIDPKDPAFQTPLVKMDPSSMAASDKLRDYLQRREVYKGEIYNDNPKHPEKGTRTIGYGHTRDVDAIAAQYPLSKYPEGLPRDAAKAILNADLVPAEDAVRKHLKAQVTQGQFDALVDYAFNAGPDALKSSPMLRHLNGDNAASAAKDFETARITQNGMPVRGLRNRRADEIDMFQTGDRLNKYTKR